MNRYSILICILLGSVAMLAARRQESFSSRVLATGLEGPWEITWGPDDQIWTTERVGKRVTRVNPADGSKITAVTISEVYEDHGQDGLLGMALHPQLLRGTGNDYVYVAYTYDADPGPGVNRKGKLRRYTYNSGTHTLQSPVDVLTSLPAGSDHLSFRLAYGPDQKLYLTVGDQGSGWLQNYCNLNRAQELPAAAEVRTGDWTRYQGKVLRLNLDGTIPSDNPTLAGVRSHIYSYGHRNAEGLAFGTDGLLYSSEHGPNTDDEVNIIEAGKNYGWPDVAGYKDDQAYTYADWSASSPMPCASLQFNATAIPPSVPQKKESTWSHPDFKPPIKTFFTVANGYDFARLGAATIAPSSADIYTARDGIPGWANSLLVSSLKLGKVYRLKLSADGHSVTGEPIEHFKSTNRYRDIAIHPGGKTIYLATDNSGRSTDASGRTTQELENPGAILEFSYRSR
ncbi:MAG TPA: glucose/sorbosone family PQQ-dependent dehydrogenase [Terriglobia bacterium]|nr:glucose/sorbosone family PQQ-dependent dehydrogenase [Terriglobia bacterium]